MRKITLAVLLAHSSLLLAETIPEQHAAKNGYSNCQSRVKEISEYLIKDNAHTAWSFWAKEATEKRLFNSIVSTEYSDGDVISTMHVAPSGKRCDYSYTRVFYFEQSCASLRETVYKDWTFGGELGRTVVLEKEGNSVKAALMTAGKGCNAIINETGFE